METKRKKCKVIMLPAKSQINQVNKGDIFINDSSEYNWGKLEALICERVTSHGHAWNGSGIKTYINHLHIISDDEIKEGDQCLYNKAHDSRNPSWELVKCGKIEREEMHPISNNKLLLWHKKLIATTNKSLKISKFSHYSQDLMKVAVYKDIYLPQIPKEFIEEYCKVEGVDEVIIEYDVHIHPDLGEVDCTLKTNSYNEIIIHSIKNNWNREELLHLSGGDSSIVDWINNTL